MSTVFLITGFNNWGKSHLIKGLFGGQRFLHDKLYPYGGHQFCVQSQSNDDIGQAGYEKIMRDRLAALRKAKKQPTHIMTAFCPSKEPINDSVSIIRNLYSNDQVHIIAIEYKWCLHAKLITNEIKSHFAANKNVTIHTLTEKNATKKLAALDRLLSPLL